jgi:hypothetical protein
MNAITKTSQPVAVRQVLVPQTFDQLLKFAELAAGTDMVPKDFRGKPGNIMLAVQMGSELGLSPMQSINSIAVINGRPGIWGDGLIGLCRQSALCQDIVETFEGEGDQRTAVCVATRRGSTPTTARFSVADAKKAGLWGKDIWAKYPDRMLQNRARGFALRDSFPDLLRGLKTVEELRDTPPDTYRGTTLDARPEPAASDPPPSPAPAKRTGRTAREWLDELALRLTAAQTIADVDAIAASDEVVKLAALWAPENDNGDIEKNRRNAANLRELNALMSDAIARPYTPHDPETGEVTEPEFPGDN